MVRCLNRRVVADGDRWRMLQQADDERRWCPR